MRHLRSALLLSGAEQRRLEAHLRWLVASGVKLTGLKKRLGALDAAQRTAIGEFLITVATADGVISPEEVTTLTTIYKRLGLDPDTVPGLLHRQLAQDLQPGHGPTPGIDLVTVRPTRRRSPGFAIPTTSPLSPAQSPGRTVRVELDEDAIATKLAETALVSALLAEIFTEDDPPSPAAREVGGRSDGTGRAASAGSPIGGLDAAHSDLLRALATQRRWSQAGYAALAEWFGLLPAGALDVLNDAALETCGEVVAEGDEDIELNDDVLRELL